jgi:hypothetical protein
MRRNLLLASVLVCLSLFCGPHLARADQADQESLSEDPIERLLSEGWRQVAEGAFQRSRGNSAVESIAFGPEGFTWRIQELQRQLEKMEAEQQLHPSKKLARVIEKQKREIDRLQEALDKGEIAASQEKVIINGCDVSYGAHADAYHQTSAQGVGAISDAYFRANCGASGHTEAYIYVRATLNGVTSTHSILDPKDGVDVTSNASWTLQGGPDCYSYASGSVNSVALGVSYSTYDESFQCPLPAMDVAITGTSSTFISGFTCRTLTWTSSVSGGVSPYSYLWTRDGVAVGYGSSYSQTFCGNDTARTETVNLRLDVTDSASATKWATFTTTINYIKKLVVENPCYPYRCTFES